MQRREFLTHLGCAAASTSMLAASAVRAQQLNVGFTRVLAPISGHISDRRIDVDLVELDEAQWFAPDGLPTAVGRYVRPILSRVKTP